nr:Uncharacterised protein [Streptococcus thermophilus]
MASSIRSRRTAIAAGALSIALIAPLTTVTPGVAESVLPAAAAAAADQFNDRYTTANFFGSKEAEVQGLTLEQGDKVEPTTNTIFNWKFRNENGTLILIRPQSSTAFKTGDVDIPVKVNPAGGKAFTTTLKVKVVDEDPNPVVPVDNSGLKDKFNDRYTTGNIWDKNEATIEGLKVDPAVKVEPTTKTAFNWTFRNAGGSLVLIRPTSAAAFKDGNVDIPVRVTPAEGDAFTTTLKVNVVNKGDDSWVGGLGDFNPRKPVDFSETGSQNVEGLNVPADAVVAKDGIAPLGWEVKNEGGVIRVTAPGTFTGDKPADIDIPVTIKKGGHTEKKTVRLAATPPKASAAGTAALGVLGSLLGSVLPGLIGGVLGGGGGEGGGGGLKLGPLVEIRDNPIHVEIKDNVRDNKAEANVEVKDNVRDNVRDNKAEAEVHDNFKDNVKDNVKENVKENGKDNKAEATVDTKVEVRDNVRDNTAKADVPVNVLPEGLFGAGGGGSSKNKDGGTGAAGGSSQMNDKCKASLIGFGVPLALLVPVLLLNVVRVPGLEPIQDRLKAAAANAGPALNIPEEQFAAGVGGFTGAFALAGLVTTLTQCVPKQPAAPAPAN